MVRYLDCSACHGAGYVDGTYGFSACDACDGFGNVEAPRPADTIESVAPIAKAPDTIRCLPPEECREEAS